MRRGALVQILLFAAIAGVVAVVMALFPAWLPTTASEQGHRIGNVFWFTTIICAAIFAIVAGVLVYSLRTFRARPGDDSDGPPIHGHTGLEIAWTAVPFVLVTAIGTYSAVVLAQNDREGSHPLNVDVTAQQFTWSFKYPDNHNLASTVLRLPVHRTAYFTLHALDVIHSFWVPEFSQKQDTVPGIETHLTITPTRTGTFSIICTELCGLGHAGMRSTVVVMSQQAFDRWAKRAGGALASGGAAAGKAVFTSAGCSGCHTLKTAGATGKVGPDLDKIQTYAQQAGQPVDAFVRESIVNPDKYIQKGYPPHVMPHTYGSLPKDQLAALVTFVVQSSKGAK